MGRFIVIVIDSFGVGAMKDVQQVRRQDMGANTALNIFKQVPNLQLPILEKMGLMNALGMEFSGHLFSKQAVFGTANLAHQGADSFLGHQEIMGTIPGVPLNQPFNEKIAEVEKHLIKAGYNVRRLGANNEPQILVINEAATVGDNLETDLGQVYNVSACLDLMPFEHVIKLGQAVREVVQVSRVIAFGGKEIGLSDLLRARRVKKSVFAGVDAPLSGVYNVGYEVVHLGYGIDVSKQLPTILDANNIPVSLIGKVADIVQTKSKSVFPGVDTKTLFSHLHNELKRQKHGFICLNIQETDLAGHAENPVRYAKYLALCDAEIGKVINNLAEADILIVMADHGNDPTIGHSNHTRERVPILVQKKKCQGIHIGERLSLSDVGATAAKYFKVAPTKHGVSFLSFLI